MGCLYVCATHEVLQVGDQGRQVLQQSLLDTASRYAGRQARASRRGSDHGSPGKGTANAGAAGQQTATTTPKKQASAAKATAESPRAALDLPASSENPRFAPIR